MEASVRAARARRGVLQNTRAHLAAAPGANVGAERFIPPELDRTNEVMRVNEVARALPKTELHLHLDGSITNEFICEAAARRGIELPPPNLLPAHIDEIRSQDMRARPGDGKKTMEAGKNWGIFDWMCQFLQTEWELEEGCKTLMESLTRDNVFYAEVRFCPELHTLEGLDVERVTAAVCRGLASGCAATGGAIRGGVIVCCLRSFSPEHSLEHAKLAHAFLGKGVVAFDTAGDEHYMLAVHEDALRYCADNGVPFTVHAGEVMAEADPKAMLPNIELALDLGATRLGHGFAICQSDALMRRAAAQGVTVEVCLPICLNPRFAWYAGSGENPYAKHPIASWYREYGLAAALSCDNITLSGTRKISSSSQLTHLVMDIGFSWAEARDVLLAGAKASFLPADEKRQLVADFEAALDATAAELGLEWVEEAAVEAAVGEP